MRGPYPGELRVRVIRFVEEGGSRREAAEQVQVSASSAIRWVQRFREDGVCEPMPRGGRLSCARLPSEQSKDCTDVSDRTFGRSILLNAGAISGMQAMNHYDRDALV